MCVFLDHQVINESPRKIQKSVMEQRVSRPDVQSESQKPFSSKGESLGKKNSDQDWLWDNEEPWVLLGNEPL